jgi:hypothetical protein
VSQLTNTGSLEPPRRDARDRCPGIPATVPGLPAERNLAHPSSGEAASPASMAPGPAEQHAHRQVPQQGHVAGAVRPQRPSRPPGSQHHGRAPATVVRAESDDPDALTLTGKTSYGPRGIGVRRDQRGAAICHALTVRDEQGPGLVAAERSWWVPTKAGARFSIHGFTPAVIGRRRQVRGPVGGGPAVRALGSVLVSFTPVRGRSPASAAACPCWSGTVMDGGERWCAVLESV